MLAVHLLGGAFRPFSPRIMKNRFLQAIRILLGKPPVGLSIDGTMLLDEPGESEFDYTKMPPFALAFDGVVADAPPVKIIREERLRVCVFPEQNGETCDGCGRTFRWLVIELRGKSKWHHLVTMHESRLGILLSVLQDVVRYLDAPETGKSSRSRRAKA